MIVSPTSPHNSIPVYFITVHLLSLLRIPLRILRIDEILRMPVGEPLEMDILYLVCHTYDWGTTTVYPRICDVIIINDVIITSSASWLVIYCFIWIPYWYILILTNYISYYVIVEHWKGMLYGFSSTVLCRTCLRFNMRKKMMRLFILWLLSNEHQNNMVDYFLIHRMCATNSYI